METEVVTLVFRVRPARQKAMSAAVAEARTLLAEFNPVVLSGGPLGDQAGVFWISLSEDCLDLATERFKFLGYSSSVDVVRFLEGNAGRRGKKGARPSWRGRPFELESLFLEDAEELRERAPDKRAFLMPAQDGTIREVRGYRGDGGELGRRGLPVADSRLLVNLAFVVEGGKLLDPFAGAGGIVIEAIALGMHVYTADIDPVLQWGLAGQGAEHYVGDSRALPYTKEMFDSVATEVPFEANAEVIADVTTEIARVLRSGGRFSMMLVESQARAVRHRLLEKELVVEVEFAIDRKGLDVVVLAGVKENRSISGDNHRTKHGLRR